MSSKTCSFYFILSILFSSDVLPRLVTPKKGCIVGAWMKPMLPDIRADDLPARRALKIIDSANITIASDLGAARCERINVIKLALTLIHSKTCPLYFKLSILFSCDVLAGPVAPKSGCILGAWLIPMLPDIRADDLPATCDLQIIDSANITIASAKVEVYMGYTKHKKGSLFERFLTWKMSYAQSERSATLYSREDRI